MDVLEQEFQVATAEHKLPAVLLAAASRDDSFNYFRSFGSTSLEDKAPPATSESTLCLASATKLVTSVAAMQCVERGLLNLDEDISKLLPEWENALILKSFDEKDGGKPVLEKAQNPITLRQLLSHSSGITGLESEEIMQYYGAMGSDKATLVPRYFMSDDPETKMNALRELREVLGTIVVEPLLFEPGTKWSYGQGTDWAGQLVERITKMSLEEYCQQNIFKPLSMTHTTYRPLSYPHVANNLIKMTSRRTSDGHIENVESIYPLLSKVDMGGANLYSSAPDFILLLKSLLRNDGKVLKPSTADVMFNYRLPDTEEFKRFRTEDVVEFYGDMAPDGMQVDYCLAGMVVMEDLKGGRKRGSVNWGGATNCYWWVDREAGICGFYGSQIMGMGEPQISFFRNFEKAVYAMYKEH